ncbi:4-demethylwyosine synthase TYW1 [Candidatus Woesearchaeota archaeon]|jgi:tRNA wybutosine-synthesizing protein 1|nr:4-demethylwyosine synthase TYW1 [Candidatus Woesearchaeota archaeon]MBT3438952.1 4-demethylwyosine synthase TYW1 [Candidatus Woesearchaeota archaeon]MBT4057957.1 4-demethylwyosine synthase TYW1 [Candidatus Woesearchaeota archaeon]MBT4206872.1 4-demethylwyosine synthase TYW1 [Candidatus Woesearchaeota archaeon]MBT4733336.1 4-demethylwyosine synthase TYW1 [Candidatus Woesearchaeota archaeon]
MITPEAKKTLTKQGYRVVGNHSVVKVCGWTGSMIRGDGGCYKLKFYGIQSHQCMQTSPSLSCANRCSFCWRGYKAPVSKDWKWEVDNPEMIINKSLKAHKNLLTGFGDNKNPNHTAHEQSKTVKHVALSLTGEPIIYPKINEMINNYHERGISTFLVTNAQYPDEIKKLTPVTQLYLSIDAPTKKLLKEIDNPLFEDYWERMIKSLENLKKKKERTAIRLTAIKDLNMCEPEKYADLIKIGNPDFIEVKGYMFIGASRERLEKSNMPLHEDVVEFSKELDKYLDDYEIASEHIRSRVVLFAKKKFKKEGEWHTWIDFDKFHELFKSGTEITTENYLKKTPTGPGLSGRGTKDRVDAKFRHKIQKY